MNTKKIAFTALVAFVSAFAAVAVFNFSGWNLQKVAFVEKTPVQLAAYSPPVGGNTQPVDFRFAAAASTPCVVHIKCTTKTTKAGL
ncbi:MAG: hypothetical protein IPP77_02855 [Bacteroidetes bacterium]|nr:hypothetical protein [Bacteroidota bacterium]